MQQQQTVADLDKEAAQLREQLAAVRKARKNAQRREARQAARRAKQEAARKEEGARQIVGELILRALAAPETAEAARDEIVAAILAVSSETEQAAAIAAIRESLDNQSSR